MANTKTVNKSRVVILDIGSRFIKGGYANHSTPSAISEAESSDRTDDFGRFPPYFHLDDLSLDVKKKAILIERFSKEPNLLALSKFYVKGRRRWLQKSLSFTSSTEFWLSSEIIRLLQDELALSPTKIKVVIIDSGLPLLNKKRICDILLNRAFVKAVLLVPESILTVLGANSREGLVINVGWSSLTLSSVVDLREVGKKVIMNDDYNGIAVHFKLLEKLLNLGDVKLNTLLEKEDCFNLMENIICNASYVRAFGDTANDESQFEVSPGVCIPSKIRYEIIESIFFGDESLCQLIKEIMKSQSIDNRKLLLQNIIFDGGITKIPGFRARFLSEIVNYLNNEEVLSRETTGSWSGCSLYMKTIDVKGIPWPKSQVTRSDFSGLLDA